MRPATRTGPIAAVLLALGLLAVPAAAEVLADLESAEIHLVLRGDGKADVTHSLAWTVRSGTMGGFYFQGEEAPFAWNPERCWADLSEGTRVPLDIRRAGERWDVLLAGGRRAAGKAHWVLSYGADLAGAGMVGRTEAAERGGLLFFHWAPPRWDEALEHRTVTVVLPIPVERGAAGDSRSDLLASLGFATEGRVNEENRIDWYAAEGDGGSYLALRFHQTDVLPRQGQELLFYFSEEAVAASFEPLLSGAAAEAAAAGEEDGQED